MAMVCRLIEEGFDQELMFMRIRVVANTVNDEARAAVH